MLTTGEGRDRQRGTTTATTEGTGDGETSSDGAWLNPIPPASESSLRARAQSARRCRYLKFSTGHNARISATAKRNNGSASTNITPITIRNALRLLSLRTLKRVPTHSTFAVRARLRFPQKSS